ncbi:MAG: NADH:flavin oxidoreductase [Nitrospiraceae bacterium]|nr:MAG: NADH:flavin oxidoreductase [Nitrospiraceae bacterium]
MTKLFEKTQIKSITIKSRFVRSATWEGMAGEDGSCTQKLTDLLVQLAKGGVGLIITGHAYVQKAGQAGPYQLGIDRDEHIPGLRNMTDAIHNAGGSIVVQLAHAGCQASVNLSGMEAVGPSVFICDGKPLCREISREEIAGTIKAFGEAALRAKKSGFDGVQLHAAHGYLMSQFLSPFYNKRTDEYGGSLENRARIVLDAYRAIRNAAGNDFPVLIKLNSEDFLEGGFTREEMIELAGMLESSGIDAVELSGGTIQSDKKLVPVRSGILPEEKEGFYREAAPQFKQRIKAPLILVGGIRSFEVAEKIIGEGIADYISMSRPLIREPNIINRWESGDHRKSACQSDNSCFRPGMRGDGIYCVTKTREKDAGDL